jgi:hypothetical protein
MLMTKKNQETILLEQKDAIIKGLKQRYNSERKTWIYGILIWLICLEALSVMALFSNVFRWVIITIGAILILLVAKLHSNAEKVRDG